MWSLSLASLLVAFALAALTVLAALAMLASCLRGRLFVVTVTGASMEPAYQDGQRLLARRARAGRAGQEIKRGQVVVLVASGVPWPGGTADPRAGRHWLVIKRVAAVAGDQMPACVAAARPELAGTVIPAGHLIVLGDNPARSHDSRQDGAVRADRVLAVALRRPR